MVDAFTEALNSPPGQLAQVLLGMFGDENRNDALPHIIKRLDRLMDSPGKPGQLARLRLSADISYLFAHVREWTIARVVPLFDWESPEAAEVWAARKFSGYIGSPELFALLKEPFLQMFNRSDVPDENLRVFAEWLVAILINNRANDIKYDLKDVEARSAVRNGGAILLQPISFRLAAEMETGLEEAKPIRWRTVIGPVFQAIWPLDIELQTSDATFNLVRILRAVGPAFAEAVDVILPFIQPEKPRSQTTVFSISREPEDFFKIAPSKLLDVVTAVVGDGPKGPIYALGTVLERLGAAEPSLREDRRFQRLRSYVSTHL